MLFDTIICKWGRIFILDKEKEIGTVVVFWLSDLHFNKLKATRSGVNESMGKWVKCEAQTVKHKV